METYRSGRNGTDSKSVVPFLVPWVRIPPSPPSKGSPLIKIKKQHSLLFYFFFFCFAFAFLANRETKYVTLVVKHGLCEQTPRYSVVLSHSLRIPPSPPYRRRKATANTASKCLPFLFTPAAPLPQKLPLFRDCAFGAKIKIVVFIPI